MRYFSCPARQILAICVLAILLAASSCNKNTISNRIVGDWKLVAYQGDGALVHVMGDNYLLDLNHDHSYRLKSDSQVYSGTYRLDNSIGSPKVVLYLSGIYSDGYEVGFSGDSLVLKYRGGFTGWGVPVSVYVRR
ncbi:MAG TPA: hypothetical protein VHD83_26215 [Puia sp.]|nr:hypothetical protein [Puia sp.]